MPAHSYRGAASAAQVRVGLSVGDPRAPPPAAAMAFEVAFDFEPELENLVQQINAPRAFANEKMRKDALAAAALSAPEGMSMQKLEEKFRTVVCRHWLRGLCMKGEQCEFLHQCVRRGAVPRSSPPTRGVVLYRSVCAHSYLFLVCACELFFALRVTFIRAAASPITRTPRRWCGRSPNRSRTYVCHWRPRGTTRRACRSAAGARAARSRTARTATSPRRRSPSVSSTRTASARTASDTHCFFYMPAR